METWPDTDVLPDPDISLAGDLDVSTLRIDMEDGRTRQRRKFSVDRLVLNIEWLLTEYELRIFIAFLKYKLNEGTDSFLMPLTLGGGSQTQTLRFIDGKYSKTYVDAGFWLVSAQLEIILQNLFCNSSVYSFITNQGTFVDLSAYFDLTVASPGAATAWRLISDSCSGSVVYATGDVDLTGKMISGSYVAGSGVGDGGSDVTGFNSADFRFWSFTELDFGVYLQVNCSGKWSGNPCIGYYLPAIPSVTFAGMGNDPRNASLTPPNGTYNIRLLAPNHWRGIHAVNNGGAEFILDPINWQLDVTRDSATARFLVTFYPVDGTTPAPDYGLGGSYSGSQRRGAIGYNQNSSGAFNSGTILIN